MNRKFQKCPDAILAISQEVAQITLRCIYPYPEELEQIGYKPVVYTDMPDNTEEGKHWESSWTEEETEIKQVWTFVEDPIYPEPELSAEDALNIIMGVM